MILMIIEKKYETLPFPRRDYFTEETLEKAQEHFDKYYKSSDWHVVNVFKAEYV